MRHCLSGLGFDKLLATILPQNQSIKSLCVWVSDEGACSLADSLCSNTKLEKLHLIFKDITQHTTRRSAAELDELDSATKRSAAALATMIRNTKTLKVLNLDLLMYKKDSLNPVICTLLESLKHSSTIEAMKIEHCFQGDVNELRKTSGEEVAKCLAETLLHNSTLKKLHLPYTKFGQKQQIVLQSLQRNTTLLELTFSKKP